MRRCHSLLILFSILISFQLTAATQPLENQLLDCINRKNLDLECVNKALAAGANPNWVYSDLGVSVIGWLSAISSTNKNNDKQGSAILKLLFKSGAKLQACDINILDDPIREDLPEFTKLLLENGADPNQKIYFDTPMEIAETYGHKDIVNILVSFGVKRLKPKIAAQLRLIQAAMDRDIPSMEKALSNGADVNGTNNNKERALVNATRFFYNPDKGLRYKIVKYLLDSGADPNIEGRGNMVTLSTALHVAVIAISDIETSGEAALKRIADSDAKRIVDLFLNDAKRTLELLLEYGAFVSSRDGLGETPLHIAAKYNNIYAAKKLIEAGSKIMPENSIGKTPLDYAESAEMIKLLKKHGAEE